MANRCVIFTAVGLVLFVGIEGYQDDSLLFCYRGSFIHINNTKQWLTGSASITPQVVNISHPDSHLISSSYLARNNYLVFGDKGTKTIFIHQDEPKNVGAYAHVGVSEGIGELGVDWVNFNVYWTDRIYSWIGLQALPRDIGNIANNDKQRIVVEKSLKKPRGLAVSPQQRYLFWTDYGDPPRIERSNLKGEERRTLIWMAIKTPLSIAVDPAASSLYWIDLARETIETCDFQGQGRRVLLQRIGLRLTSLTVFENSVIYTEAKDTNIHAVSKVTGVQSAHDLDLDGEPEGLTVFSESMQPFTTSPCDSYGCSHICVQTSQGPECLCDGGFRLAANDKTCTESPTDAVWKSIIYSDGTYIRAFPVTTFNSYPFVDIEVTNLTSGANVTSLATDSKSNTVFFVTGRDVRRKAIGGIEFTVTTAAKEITGLVMDTLDRKLFWTEAEEGLIQTSGIAPNSESTEVYRELRTPGDIAIDVKNRRLFWVSSPPPSRIETGAVSGGATSVLVSTSLTQPQRLTFDPQRSRLYWTEDGQIGSILADGTGRLTQPLGNLPTYLGVVVFKDYLAWTTTTTTNRVNLSVSIIQDNGNIAEPIAFTIPDITMVTDIVVFEADDYKMETDGCIVDNGGCQQICLPQDTGNTCGCKFGFRLEDDQKSCNSDVVDENFSLVIDSSNNAIYQVLPNNVVFGVGVLPANTPSVLQFDWQRHEIVWYDEVRHLIMRASLNGSDERVVSGTEEFTVRGMDIDPSTSNIYYTMTSSTKENGFIRVITHDGVVSRTLVNTTKTPGPVLVFPKNGLLLWGEDNDVKQADMSGASVSTLVSSGLSSVSDISLDSSGDVLYIADSTGDTIKSFEITTRTSDNLRQNTQEYPTNIAVKGDNLLYLSKEGRTIKEINRLTGVELSAYADVAEFGQLTGLYVYSNEATSANEECSVSNGGCTALCLPNTSGRVCACADGVNLDEEQLFCESDKMCPEELRNGALASACVRYPNRMCTFTCSQGYVPKSSSKLTCLQTGQWDAPLDTLCVGDIKCPTQINNGELAEDCLPNSNSMCTFVCDDGYVPKTSTISCLPSGQWNSSLDSLCDKDTVNIAVIIGVVLGVLVVVAVIILVICWKRGACRSRSPDPFPSHSMSRDPVIIVTKDEEIYDEIKDPAAGSERYTSFRKVSPNPIRKQLMEHSEIHNPAYSGFLTPKDVLPLPHPRPPDFVRSESPAPDYEQMHPEDDGYLDLSHWSSHFN